ncbi:hypothetical protein WN944_005817 [Citrus x changshan-huyou]|uniref:Uncharacterized protein n=1 Tax=Citrus x changshan-huyou TaxID=2935761 RepID=A0AAP0MKN0_9ROSI
MGASDVRSGTQPVAQLIRTKSTAMVMGFDRGFSSFQRRRSGGRNRLLESGQGRRFPGRIRAALLLGAGAKGNRAALPSSTIMIKQPIGRIEGQATDVEIARKEIKNVKAELKYFDETRHGEQISDGRVLRTDVFLKSLVRGGTGAEIPCSSTSTSSARAISCKRHKAIPARGREARRPGRQQLARHALQPENLGTTATLSPEPRRNTQDPTRNPIPSPKERKQDLTEPRQPRFPQNRGVTRKIPRFPITQQSESHTVSKKAENWDSEEAYKKVANEGKKNLGRRSLARRPPGRDEVDRAEILVVEQGEPESRINILAPSVGTRAKSFC